MSFPKKPLIIASAVFLGLVAWFILKGDGDIAAIRQQLDELVEVVEKEGPVPPFEALGRSQKLKSKFTERLLFEYLPGKSLPRDRDELGAAFLGVWSKLDRISIRVLRHDVSVDENKYEAESSLSANCSVVMDGAERMGDTFEYIVFWTKVDGEWLIERLIAQ
jgi:hypothetical protein